MLFKTGIGWISNRLSSSSTKSINPLAVPFSFGLGSYGLFSVLSGVSLSDFFIVPGDERKISSSLARMRRIEECRDKLRNQ